MTNSPRRLLFAGTLICFLFGMLFNLINVRLSNSPAIFPTENSLGNADNLSVARYYWRIGKFEKAIEEYQRVIPTLPQKDLNSANEELKKLLLLDKSASGRVIGYVAYYTWSLPPRLYALAGLFGVLFIVLLLYRLVKKEPKFIIQPFYDRASLGIGNDLHRTAVERIRELLWRSQNLEGITGLIADNLEVPTLSLMSEGDNQRAIELLEIALLFSVGSTSLPFSQLISAVKLWLEQPQFLVRGVIDRQGDVIILRMSLLDRKSNSIEKLWYIEIPFKKDLPVSKVIDAIIYPLLYHFNKLTAGCWEALQALHNGLEEFQLFKENQSAPTHLELARQQLEAAILLDPAYDLARYNLSLFLLATGEFERSRGYLRELSTVGLDPQLRLRAKYNYGTALFHVSQDWAYEQAAKVFRELLDQEESRPLEDLIRSALSLTCAKMAGRRSKESGILINEALAEANRVIENANPSLKKNKRLEKEIRISKEALANAIAARGFVHLASEDYQQAIECFKQSMQTYPASLSSMLGLGEAYIHGNLKDEALDTFRKAVIRSPLSGYTSYRLGNLYREMGKYDEAIDVLKRAPRYAYARLCLGKIYLESEEFENALEEFRRAAELNDRLSEAWVNVAWTILQMENPALIKEALTAARRSLHLEKNEKQYWHRHAILAFCLYLSGKKDPALSEAKRAVELGPKQAQAHYYLALAQYGVGRYEHAQQSIEKVKALDKKGDWETKATQLQSQLP